MRHWMVSLLLLAGCESLENRLVYCPTVSDPKNAVALPAPLQNIELQSADGNKIHACWCPNPQAHSVLLFCHGNAGNLEHYGSGLDLFSKSFGCSVLMFDYPGYGKSQGTPSEKGCYASAHAAYDWLTKAQNVSPDKIVLCGESLGGGVAVELASKRPHQALVLIRTFTSVPAVASQHLFHSSAPELLMVNRFDSLSRISQCKSPIFIAQSDGDHLMPFEHGEQLRDACKAPVQFYRLRGLDHNDPLPAEFFVELRRFLSTAKGQEL